MMNKIWGFFIISGSIYCILTGRIDVLNKEILESSNETFKLIVKIFPVLALWLGIMNIASSSGLLNKMSEKLSPVLTKLFPDIPYGHESLGLIASNIVVNMMGLGNAATPFGLKAMKSLQKLNKKKETATRSMITFLAINTSGVTIIPTTVISMRLMHKSINPTIIVLPCIIATIISLISALIIDRVFYKRNMNA